MSLVSYVVEEPSRGEQSYGILSRLLKDRIILFDEKANDVNAGLVAVRFLFLESGDLGKDINLHINSSGDSVTVGMATYSTIQYVKYDVSTIYIGMAASMSAFLFSDDTEDKRYALSNAEIMIHQPSGGAQGQGMEIHIAAE